MPVNPFVSLMIAARTHASLHGARTPALCPQDSTLLGKDPPVNVTELHQIGFSVIPWTTNDPATMRTLIALGVDGLISDRPDLLQQVAHRANFAIVGHRGARDLRPENTLPAFEAGLDHLVTALETDIGITTDHRCLISHDQFLSPHTCRRADGVPYTLDNRVYVRDISFSEAQTAFICDKLHPAQSPHQVNDLALSPVSVAFAAHEGLIHPYVPICIEQLFRFTSFYADYYRTGPGKSYPEAATRSAHAAKVGFFIETKILPLPNDPEGRSVTTLPLPAESEPTTNHTLPPEIFVATLCRAIERNHIEDRARILSFDFRILQLVEAQHPAIRTCYLTESAASLGTAFLPSSLRQRF